MKPIEEHLCNVMYDFVKEHINEVKDCWKRLGFNDSEDLLNQIKTDFDTAYWALTELCFWGLAKDYYTEYFVVADTDDYVVYKLGDRYMMNLYSENNWKEVEKTTKLIEVVEWQNKE